MNELDPNNIPKHIAFIMDGNGRWAKKRHLPRKFGHKAGMDALHRIVEAADDLDVDIITVYAFSTENWKRAEDEVDFLMNLAVEYFIKELDELVEKNVKVKMFGERDRLPEKVQQAAKTMEEKTQNNTGLQLNVCLNYGGRDEVTRAVKNIIKDGIPVEDITEETISDYLYTSGLPDPDLLVRTGGEQRLSNFMLWQNSYAEFIFTDTWWPDCDKAFLVDMIKEYQGRQRRFGNVNED